MNGRCSPSTCNLGSLQLVLDLYPISFLFTFPFVYMCVARIETRMLVDLPAF